MGIGSQYRHAVSLLRTIQGPSECRGRMKIHESEEMLGTPGIDGFRLECSQAIEGAAEALYFGDLYNMGRGPVM